VPFTLRNIKGDLDDIGSRFDGAADLEFRAATAARAREQSGLSYQRIPPVRGSGRMKLDDEIVELEEWDAVRVPPGTWRGYEAGPEGLEILVFAAPSEPQRDDVDGQRDWWTDS